MLSETNEVLEIINLKVSDVVQGFGCSTANANAVIF